MKKLLPILVVLLLVGGFAGYTLAKPKSKAPVLKVNGTIYILPKAFTLNLSGGQYATLTVALLLAPTQSAGTTDPSNPPPTGFGSLNEEAVIRAIITDDLTNQPASALITQSGRMALEKKVLHDIKTQTDDSITNIYFTDLAVQ
jgi:flagellar FliL protein